jgi:pimeloyl-ACP methyl ester carboxylesterase
VREAFWLLGMQASIAAAYDCIKAFSETDQTGDLKKIDVPALLIQGDADPDRADRELGKAERKDTQKWKPKGDSGRSTRTLHDTCGCHQRVVAGVH